MDWVQLLPPPITNIWPLKASASISLVALGIGAIELVVLAIRLESERVGGVHYRPTLEIQSAPDVDAVPR